MPVMTTVDQVLKELNIPYFLQFGTLLGGFRERGIINSDYDIDIGIMQEDWCVCV
jgi:lipopolysaccharide cholinephosphotransferase